MGNDKDNNKPIKKNLKKNKKNKKHHFDKIDPKLLEIIENENNEEKNIKETPINIELDFQNIDNTKNNNDNKQNNGEIILHNNQTDNNPFSENILKNKTFFHISPINNINSQTSTPNILREIFSKIIDKIDENEKKEEDEMDVDDFYNNDDYDEIIQHDINNIDDLIELGKLYNPDIKKKYNINIKKLNQLIEPLTLLNNMIGMYSVKQQVVDFIIYYLQDFEKNNTDMLHTAIYAGPGSGKTEIAKILAKIYSKMGVVKKDIFITAKRTDLIGEYLGHTAVKTQNIINSAEGGVLFIDEIYSLGNSENKDNFSKECIDTINLNLTEKKNKFICIIAGYRDAIEKSFFSYNAGLERRFPFRFTIDEYNALDLKKIYIKMIKDAKWFLPNNDDISDEFFYNNRNYFKYNGGDMETLFHLTKIVHARRVFCLPKSEKKIIKQIDLEKAFNIFINDEEIRKRNENFNIDHMYL